ncbi:unnamed protein product [Linum tenue]|uniref:Phytosulfokine n=1 Tax=Linum tenue TaxID=586396 RepID=A0AAV0JDY2_9ROSI|nr:unnamed protein product [Linum tenue]
MKRNSSTPLLLLLLAFLLLSRSFSASARLLLEAETSSQTKVGSSDAGGQTELVRREDQKTAAADHFASAGSLKEEDFSTLMGAEELENAEGVCEENDEDCLKRRMVAEAHLDYIYTQHHKNP